MNAHPYPRKIIQTPTEVILIYEGSGTTVREVFLDGRTLPQGCGAVVERLFGRPLGGRHAGRRNDRVHGRRLAGRARQPAHQRREDHRAVPPVKYGYLELEETIDDPKVYTKPFTAKLY